MLNPIGVVHADFYKVDQVPVKGGKAFIEIYSEYLPALLRIEENSHLWLQLWFHEAERDILRIIPKKINKNLPEYGVFALRAYKRPNPVALTLVSLKEVVKDGLLVEGLDAIDGTPVIDIKPYYEKDIVFSPRTPYIRAINFNMQRELFFGEALSHHQEECPSLYLGVRMALVAEKIMGQITKQDIYISVQGSLCLGDVLQGLTHARLANPPRFTFLESSKGMQSAWNNGRSKLVLKARCELDKNKFLDMKDEKLFDLEIL